MTLLFATFVVLYGLKSEGETEEIRGIVSSIREAFVEIPDQIDDPNMGPTHKGVHVFKNWKLDKIKQNKIKKFNRNRNHINLIDKELEKIRRLLQTDSKKPIEPYFKKPSANLSVIKSGSNIVVNLGASLLYEKGSYRLNRSSIKNLDLFASYLAELKKPIIIQAYARNRSVKTTGLTLASLRASFLLRYLNRKYDVPISLLQAQGYELIYNESSEEIISDPKLLDRVDIKIVYD